MRRFKWIDWNLGKIDAHALSAQEVEGSFNRVVSLQERIDGSFKMLATAPSGRRIWVIWRYNEGVEMPDILDDLDDPSIFVITAY